MPQISMWEALPVMKLRSVHSVHNPELSLARLAGRHQIRADEVVPKCCTVGTFPFGKTV